MSESEAEQIKLEVREFLRVHYKKLRKQTKTDFPCFVAMILGSMHGLYLCYFDLNNLVDDEGIYHAGFYDEENVQIIQNLVLSDGYYGLLNLSGENGLGDENERVLESHLLTLWEDWKATALGL